MRLHAIFNTPEKLLRCIAAQMETYHSSRYNFTFSTNSLGYTSVTGRAQEVMFLIGEAANHGEDGLISVSGV